MPTWIVPAAWRALPSSPPLVVAAFAAGPDGAARVTLTPLAGDAGGLLANVNRWRAQVGLEAVRDPAEQLIETIAAAGGSARVVHLLGPAEASPRDALSVALLRDPGGTDERTWYIKIAGPGASVAGERERFLAFVRSVAFPRGGDER